MDSYYRFLSVVVIALSLAVTVIWGVCEFGEVERARLHCAPATSGSAP